MAEQQQSSAAAAAVTTPPAVTTSTTIAQARAPSKNFVSTLEMSADEKATAPPLEPAFEALLRSGNIHEEVIWACRIQDILDREVFVALHHTVEGFTQAVSAGLGIDPAMGFSHNREMAKMVKAWNSAKIQADIKTKVDAVAKAHGEPVSMLKCDWISLMTRFGDQHGDNIHESRLPAQSYFENFEEALADGSLEAERLDQVLNVVEERAELAKTPNAAKHLGIHLDASLTIQTKRRFSSVLPATTEDLRLKFSVMSNLWLLAKMRQPARQIFADFTETTFPKILDELLSEKNFLLDRNIAGTRMIVPKWDHCLEYEYQVRRQAIKLCVRKGYSFQSAWWTVYRDVEHRMEHWVQLLTIANSSSDLAHTPSASAAVHNTEVAQLRREVDRLRQSVRSRSPRGGRGQGTQLALSNHPFQNNNGKKSFGGRKTKTAKGNGKKGGKKSQEAATSGAARSSAGKTFDEILKDPAAKSFMTVNHQNGKVCWHFQKNACTRNCKRLHECAGCGKPGIGYDACRCQASRV